MTFKELRKKEGRISGLVALERVMPSRARARAKELLLLVAPLFLMIVLFFEEQTVLPASTLYGIVLIVVACWLVIFMLDCFYYAHYFKGAHFSLPEWGIGRHELEVPYEVLEIVSHTNPADLTRGFLSSRAAADLMLRLDISKQDIAKFLASDNRQRFYADSVNFAEPVGLLTYATTVFDIDKDFRNFLAERGVKRVDFAGAIAWVAAIYARQKEAHRWWGRDSLGRIRGVGKDWVQGDTYLLEKYGDFVETETDEILFKKETDELEKVLARTTGANALLVAEEKSEFLMVVNGLAGRITDGSVLPPIQHKRLFILNENFLNEKLPSASPAGAVVGAEFEILITRLFNQAVTAGHIVLVIPNLPNFVETAKRNDINVVDFFEPYATSPNLQLVAFVPKNQYASLAGQPALLALFEPINIENENHAVLMRALEQRVYDIERQTHLFFTYESLAAVVAAAGGQALKIFDELVPRLIQRRVRKVAAADVAELISLKIGERKTRELP